MQITRWLEANERGRIEHEWGVVRVEVGGHVGIFRVSADAARVGGVRPNGTARTAQLLADELDALLLTAKLYEARWEAAGVRVPPSPGNVAHTTAQEHSRRVDELVLAAGGELKKSRQIIADVGKAWVLDLRCTPTVAVNHGWVVPPTEVRWSGGRAYWRGIPVVSCVSLPGHHLIQHRGGRHGLGHSDYSQVMLFVHSVCVVDGVETATADVYESPELACLVTHDGRPLPFSRQPGVAQLLTHVEFDPAAATEPSPVDMSSWQDPGMTLGERCVAWSIAQKGLGVKEEPAGSNNGPRIREFLRWCERDGQPGFGDYLARAGGNWCAAFYCAADAACRLPAEPLIHKRRASGIELERDAKASKAWHDADEVRRGDWNPEPGDGVLFQRGNPRVPSDAWKRHVARFVCWEDEGRTFTTIGGNERDQVRRTTQRLADPLLLGFIENPRQAAPGADSSVLWRVAELDRKLREGFDGMDEVEALIAQLDDLEDGDDAVG